MRILSFIELDDLSLDKEFLLILFKKKKINNSVIF